MRELILKHNIYSYNCKITLKIYKLLCVYWAKINCILFYPKFIQYTLLRKDINDNINKNNSPKDSTINRSRHA